MFSLGSTMTYDRFLNLYFLFEQRPLHTKKLTKKRVSGRSKSNPYFMDLPRHTTGI